MNPLQPMGRAQPAPRAGRPALPAKAAAPKPRRPLADLAEDDLPCSDGQPMADSGRQANAVIYAREALRVRYAQRADVAIEADMFLYYLPPPGAPEPPDGRYPNIVPDCMVAFGAARRDGRKSYVIAQEGIARPGKVPDFVLEVASDSTWSRDYGEKRRIYASIGVPEYFVFDARETPRTASRILGLRLRGGRYEPIAAGRMPGGGDGVYSPALDLYAYARGEELRLRTAAGEDLRSLGEEVQARRDAEQQVAELKAQLARLRAVSRDQA